MSTTGARVCYNNTPFTLHKRHNAIMGASSILVSR